MFGKHFASMYTGSMVGAGAVPFAVMGFVIANQVPDKTVGSQVELNPALLAFIIGEPQEKIEKAIEYLCQPDPSSRTDAENGRRLVKLGQFAYQVVNGAKYRAIRDQERRRETDRESKRRMREEKKNKIKKSSPTKAEQNYQKDFEEHGQQYADEQLDKRQADSQSPP